MKAILCLFVIFASAFALTEKDYQTAFSNWMRVHQKSYHHSDFQLRYNVFKANLDFVNHHNSLGKSYTVATNIFADLTNEEFRRLYTGLNLPTIIPSTPILSKANADLPASWDWRNYSAVTPVKDQGQCGSCWAFSTTGSTEGCHQITTKKLVSLSEQNLVDCSGSYGNQGCNGGLMTQAMDYIIANHGIDTEKSYPYHATDGTCKFTAANVGATLKSYTNVKSGDENDLQTKVYAGPTSVAIDAGLPSFQLYHSGVYNEPSCSSTALDHGVLAVGWGTLATVPYWTVKNSWSTSWGMQGYILMSRNKNNQCGIATMATLPSC
jgi:cathepsin L